MLLFKKLHKQLEDLCLTQQNTLKYVEELKESHGHQKQLMTDLIQAVDKNHSAVLKQGMSLEDVLETLEEQQNREHMEQQHIRELESDLGVLLAVIGDYQELMWQLKGCSDGQDVAWKQQLTGADEKIRFKMKAAGIGFIDTDGCPVDYELHQIIAVEGTDREDLHGTVKQIYNPGCIYKGTVLKKGQISAWRFDK